MDLTRLPDTFLTSLRMYLNASDCFSVLNAGYSVESANYLYSALVDPKTCDLSKTTRLDSKRAKVILNNLYRNTLESLETLNLNFTHLVNLHQLVDYKRLKSLKVLNIIDSRLDFAELGSIVRELPTLTSISLGLKAEFLKKDVKYDEELLVSENLVELKLAVYTGSSLTALFKHLEFRNATNLELYYLNDELRVLYMENDLIAWPSSVISILFNNKIYMRRFTPELFEKYENFNLSFGLEDNDLSQLKHVNRVRQVEIRIDLDKVKDPLINSNDKHLFEFDSYLEERFGHLLDSKLSHMVISSNRFSYCMNQVNTRISECSNLTKLDLKSIHIHSESSICKHISGLKNLRVLFLPCCALASEQFKKQSVSFKRIFDELDEEESPVVTNSLSHLNHLRIRKFAICQPVMPTSRKDKILVNCKSIDSSELMELVNWQYLKSLYIGHARVACSGVKFEQVFKELSTKTTLTELILNQLSNFVMYEYQQKLSIYLKSMSHLRRLRIDHLDLDFNQGFISSLCSLSELQYLQLRVKQVNPDLIEKNMSSLEKLNDLVYIEIKCGNTSRSIQSLHSILKRLKKSTSERLNIVVDKLDSGEETTHRNEPGLTLSNTQLEFKPSDFLLVSPPTDVTFFNI